MTAKAGQDGSVPVMSWAERAADQSALMRQWRSRNVRQMQAMVEAAKRLIARKGSSFTTQPARYITAEHWRLHQLFPEEMALATQPIVDLFAREIRAAQEQGLITVDDTDQSAELMVMLVRVVYHQYAFAKKDEPTAEIAEHVWEFCLQGIGGRTEGRDAPALAQ